MCAHIRATCMFMNDIQCYVILIAYSGHIVKTINNITNNK